MPAVDSGDVFLRHRGAILDALLADPSFGEAAAATSAEPVPSGAIVGEPVSGPVGDPSATAPAVGAPIGSGPVQAPRRRTSDGQKASARIIALLNGQSPDSTPPPNFSSDFSEASGKRAAAAQPTESPSAPSRSSTVRGPDVAKLIKQLKNPKIALAVCAFLAVLLILVLVTTSTEENTATDPIAVITPAAAAATSTPAPTGAASAVIPVKSAQAHCPPGSTPGLDAFSGQQGKAWSCVRAYKVDGQVLTIDLGKVYQVDSIGIVPGWDGVDSGGADQWAKFRTVSRVSYQFDDPNKTTYTQQTLDQRSLVVTNFTVPVQASTVVLTILESKGDPTINTTAIASIVITGH